MILLNVDNLKEETMQKCMFYWKNHSTLYPMLRKTNKGGCVVLDWLSALVEYRLKKETINSLKRKFIDVFFSIIPKISQKFSYKNKLKSIWIV